MRDAPYRLSEWLGSTRKLRAGTCDNDINVFIDSRVRDFHHALLGESARRAQALSWGTSVGRPNVPTWKVLDMAIEAGLEPGLALECAEHWGFDRADLGG